MRSLLAVRPRVLGVLMLAAVLLGGCSVRTLAINGLADALASSAAAYAADPDPELVRDALPFALKTTESLLLEAPRHQGLLLSACSGFTQYAYAFVEVDAERLEEESFHAAEAARRRALGLYLRARDYCLRGLEILSPGIGPQLVQEPRVAAARLEGEAIEWIYWTAASWGAAISVALDRPEIVVDLPVVRALMARALELDEAFDDGAVHEAMISLEALPVAMGGSPEKAREHFERAVELSAGQSASPYLAYGVSVVLGEQDRKAFEGLLNQALAVDLEAAPERRLANVLAQRRARWLLARVDDIFLE